MSETYRYFFDDWTGCSGMEAIELGTNILRPPTICSVWVGVYSVPNGANVGIAAVA